MRGALVFVVAATVSGACGDDGGGGGGGSGPFFKQHMFFNDDVSGAAASDKSPGMLGSLRRAGGWGNGDSMQIDFSFDILEADGDATMRTFEKTDDFYEPDCDHVEMPVPRIGNIEGESGYACESDGDCHLLVFHKPSGKLYEMWRANIVSDTFFGGCLAVWDTNRKYDRSLRGEQCTSADAAGFPIAPMLFTADEVASGSIEHAIRLILPNDRIAQSYVAPATHGTNTTGGTNAPSYGFHMRLKSSFDVDSLPSEGAKVVARAMQKYGMYHSDGGNIALTAASDRYSTAKWDGLLDAHDLSDLTIEDFEVIDHGEATPVTQHCTR